jgi:hypothetical protein
MITSRGRLISVGSEDRSASTDNIYILESFLSPIVLVTLHAVLEKGKHVFVTTAYTDILLLSFN